MSCPCLERRISIEYLSAPGNNLLIQTFRGIKFNLISNIGDSDRLLFILLIIHSIRARVTPTRVDLLILLLYLLKNESIDRDLVTRV
jgi:hypothetical protein